MDTERKRLKVREKALALKSNKTKAVGEEIAGSESQRKGLEFMPVRANVLHRMRELYKMKLVTPSEYFLLQEIHIGTAGGYPEYGPMKICESREFNVHSLSKLLGYKEADKIWGLLKLLDEKKLISREKTLSRGTEILGLNKNYFGQILIDAQQRLNNLNAIKCVVDNSKAKKRLPTKRRDLTDETSGDYRRTIGHEPTNRRGTGAQVLEITHKKDLLEPFRTIESLRTGTESSHGWDENGPDKAREILKNIKKNM